LKKELKEHGVKLIGGGLDEVPFAYKDIKEVNRRSFEKGIRKLLGSKAG
jgi:RNA-splicing ligase RtcB